MRLDQQSLLGRVLELEFNGSRRKLEAFFQFRISGFLQIQLFDFQCCFRRHPVFPVKPFHGSFPDFWSWQLRIVLNDPQNPGNVFLLPDHSQEHHRTPGFDPDAALIKTFSDQGQPPFWKGIEGLNRLQPFSCDGLSSMGNHCSSNASWASSANQALTGVEAQISNKAEKMETNVGLKFLRFMNQHKPETSAQGDEGMEFKLTLNPRICNEESPEYISQS